MISANINGRIGVHSLQEDLSEVSSNVDYLLYVLKVNSDVIQAFAHIMTVPTTSCNTVLFFRTLTSVTS